jgi:3-(methylthio)propanoyl-CoA dehydrogenase
MHLTYRAPIHSWQFWLYDVWKIDQYSPLDRNTCDQLLEHTSHWLEHVLAPLNNIGDRHGATFDGKNVTMPTGFKQAYHDYVTMGLVGMNMPIQWNGLALPNVLTHFLEEGSNSANMAFTLCPMLTQSGLRLLLNHATPSLQATYLPPLIKGLWSATMCLTEPNAGSDLHAIRTMATPYLDHWFIQGQKIIHLVLARTPNAPLGAKGLSLFLVPNWWRNDQNQRYENMISCQGIEHKLGIHGSPTCTMQFGNDNQGATGWLIGELHQGLKSMFSMMNHARISVGIQGYAIAERALQAALTYSQERRQGRMAGMSFLESVTIDQHPLIAHSLLGMRAHIEALRGLASFLGYLQDQAHINHEPYQSLVDFFTPIFKSEATDQGVRLCSEAMQIHGGFGYMEESGLPQLLRDCRITPIYEGTNAIQALDFIMRKWTNPKARTAWQSYYRPWLEQLATLDPTYHKKCHPLIMQWERWMEQLTDYHQQGNQDYLLTHAIELTRYMAYMTQLCLLIKGFISALAAHTPQSTQVSSFKNFLDYWLSVRLPQ